MVPGMAAECCVKCCGWHGMQGVRGSKSPQLHQQGQVSDLPPCVLRGWPPRRRNRWVHSSLRVDGTVLFVDYHYLDWVGFPCELPGSPLDRR